MTEKNDRKEINEFCDGIINPFRKLILSQLEKKQNSKKDYQYYLAYGSNLNIQQMHERCPNALYVGKSMLKGYKLVFRGSKSGYYLSIDKNEESEVPVIVWAITKEDEESLDYYEGFPNYYKKMVVNVPVYSLGNDVFLGEVCAMIYYLPEDNKKGCPTPRYWKCCQKGYEYFGMNIEYLENALFDSVSKRQYIALLCRL